MPSTVRAIQVFVSSATDLTEERDSVARAILKTRGRMVFVGMEAFGATPNPPDHISLHVLGKSDLYLGVFSDRLGEYTALEYQRALKDGYPCLLFFRRLDGPSSPELQALKNEVSGSTYVEFEDARDLELQVLVTLVNYLLDSGGVDESYDAPIRALIAKYLDPKALFLGRERDMELLDTWISAPSAEPVLLVTAPGGRGKTALLTRWVEHQTLEEKRSIIFVPISIEHQTNELLFFLRALAVPLLRALKRPMPSIQNVASWREAVVDALAQGLPAGEERLIVVDGLDECGEPAAWSGLFPTKPGPGVRIVVSARVVNRSDDQSAWLDRLGWRAPAMVGQLDLPPLDASTVLELVRAKQLENDQEKISVELFRLTRGEPFLLNLYLDALSTRSIAAEALPSLAPGLKAWVDEAIRVLEANPAMDAQRREQVQQVANVLGSAFASLPREVIWQVARTLGTDMRAVGIALDALERLVLQRGGKFQFSAPQIAEHWRESLGREALEWDQRFVAAGRGLIREVDADRLRPESVPAYFGRYLADHLSRGECPTADFRALTTDTWRRISSSIDPPQFRFRRDVEIAATAFAKEDLQAARRDAVLPFLGDEIRCAVISSSLNTRVETVPPDLLVAATREGLYSLQQAIAEARQIPNPNRRAAALMGLGELSSGALRVAVLGDALREAGDISGRAFGNLFTQHREAYRALPELMPAALALARARRDEFAFAAVIPALSHKEQAAAALEALGFLSTSISASEASTASLEESLVARLPAREEMAAGIRRVVRVAVSLLRLVDPARRSDHFARFEALARTIQEDETRAATLGVLATVADESHAKLLLDEALAIGERAPEVAGAIIGDAAKHLPQTLLPELSERVRRLRTPVAQALGSAGLAAGYEDALARSQESRRLLQLLRAQPNALHSEEIVPAASRMPKEELLELAQILATMPEQQPDRLFGDRVSAIAELWPAEAWAVVEARATRHADALRDHTVQEAIEEAFMWPAPRVAMLASQLVRSVQPQPRATAFRALLPAYSDARRREILERELAIARTPGDEVATIESAAGLLRAAGGAHVESIASIAWQISWSLPTLKRGRPQSRLLSSLARDEQAAAKTRWERDFFSVRRAAETLLRLREKDEEYTTTAVAAARLAVHDSLFARDRAQAIGLLAPHMGRIQRWSSQRALLKLRAASPLDQPEIVAAQAALHSGAARKRLINEAERLILAGEHPAQHDEALEWIVALAEPEEREQLIARVREHVERDACEHCRIQTRGVLAPFVAHMNPKAMLSAAISVDRLDLRERSLSRCAARMSRMPLGECAALLANLLLSNAISGAGRTRAVSTLVALTPVIARLGGPAAVVLTAISVMEIHGWWSRVDSPLERAKLKLADLARVLQAQPEQAENRPLVPRDPLFGFPDLTPIDVDPEGHIKIMAARLSAQLAEVEQRMARDENVETFAVLESASATLRSMSDAANDPNRIAKFYSLQARRFGALHFRARRLDAARASFDRAESEARRYAAAAPEDPEGPVDISIACDKLGSTLLNLGEPVGSSRVDLQACKLEYSIVSPK